MSLHSQPHAQPEDLKGGRGWIRFGSGDRGWAVLGWAAPLSNGYLPLDISVSLSVKINRVTTTSLKMKNKK